MKAKLRRDTQQWLLEWVVKTTGKTINILDGPITVPQDERIPDVKNYGMLSKLMGKVAKRHADVARAALESGDRETARELYYRATQHYYQAQHQIFEDDDAEKIDLANRLDECYDRLAELADYPIERVEIPFEGATFPGIFHLLPGRPKAPTILWVPGMDVTKERCMNPMNNEYGRRGMHVLAIDGPGQGRSNLRKLRITADNYERAGKAAIDYLVTRPEVDADKIGVYGMSMGSYWAPRIAATDDRIKACATSAACMGSKRFIFDMAPPRFKQIFMYMSGLKDEAEFDKMVESMTLIGWGEKIKCPILMCAGEFDDLCPMEETEAVFKEIAGPKEVWLFDDGFHGVSNSPALGGVGQEPFVTDWFRDKLNGNYPKDLSRWAVISLNGRGPY